MEQWSPTSVGHATWLAPREGGTFNLKRGVSMTPLGKWMFSLHRGDSPASRRPENFSSLKSSQQGQAMAPVSPKARRLGLQSWAGGPAADSTEEDRGRQAASQSDGQLDHAKMGVLLGQWGQERVMELQPVLNMCYFLN